MTVFRYFSYSISSNNGKCFISETDGIIYDDGVTEMFKEQTIQLYKHMHTLCDFWVIVNDPKFFIVSSDFFTTKDYTLMELLQIIAATLRDNGGSLQLKHAEEKALVNRSAKAVIDILTQLQPNLAASGCLQMLLDDETSLSKKIKEYYVPF